MGEWPQESDELQELIDVLRRSPARPPDAVDAIVRRARRTAGVRHRLRDAWAWLSTPRFSPLGSAALAAAGMAALLLVAPWQGEPSSTLTPGVGPPVVLHQFVLVAPGASSVSVVGDFNDWRVGATPLTPSGGVWTVQVSLEPGRHVYSFVVDEVQWSADARAPRAAEDEFGRPSSVVLIEPRTGRST